MYDMRDSEYMLYIVYAEFNTAISYDFQANSYCFPMQ